MAVAMQITYLQTQVLPCSNLVYIFYNRIYDKHDKCQTLWETILLGLILKCI